MTRLPLLDDAADPALAARIRAERGGKLLALYRVLMHSPGVAGAWLQFFTVIRQQCSLPARTRELAILQVAVANRARYEFEQHVPFALAAGLEARQLDGLKMGDLEAVRPLFEAADFAVLAYTDAMTRSIQVPDDVFDAVKRRLPDDQMVELTATVAGYNMVSRFLEALHIHEEPAR
ncbi:MAG: carboxymuconolactone decarboxylase family protein [Betaproteobacteria bacterium]|nr:carboxymuconolactone decarboxylase family protein [Betaproteobacteria bacterium]